MVYDIIVSYMPVLLWVMVLLSFVSIHFGTCQPL